MQYCSVHYCEYPCILADACPPSAHAHLILNLFFGGGGQKLHYSSCVYIFRWLILTTLKITSTFFFFILLVFHKVIFLLFYYSIFFIRGLVCFTLPLLVVRPRKTYLWLAQRAIKKVHDCNGSHAKLFPDSGHDFLKYTL